VSVSEKRVYGVKGNGPLGRSQGVFVNSPNLRRGIRVAGVTGAQ